MPQTHTPLIEVPDLPHVAAERGSYMSVCVVYPDVQAETVDRPCNSSTEPKFAKIFRTY